MKINNIKTKKEFYEFADIWYNRTHRLREIWQNITETDERKIRAFTLWLIMYNRVMKLISISMQIKNHEDIKTSKDSSFIQGGVFSSKDSYDKNGEFIINRNKN